MPSGIDSIWNIMPLNSLSVTAVSKTRSCLDYNVVAPKYIELYQSVLKKDKQ